jgi:hypothetical protein
MAGYSISQVAGRTGIPASLDGPTPDGACDDTCDCVPDAAPAGVAPDREPDAEVPIACTLTRDQIGTRMADWRVLVASATGRHRVPGGARLRFGRAGVDVASIAALMAAEQDCCRFFTFAMTLVGDEVVLEITAPVDAQPFVDALIGDEA